MLKMPPPWPANGNQLPEQDASPWPHMVSGHIPMRYEDLGITTRREAPARARSTGDALLTRAGYLTADGKLTKLGLRSISRLRASYAPIPDALRRVGLPVIQLERDGLAWIASAGETQVLICPSCGYADAAHRARARKTTKSADALALRKVATPHCETIETLAAYLDVDSAQTAKAMMYTRISDGRLVFVVLRGDMQVSEEKLRGLIGDIRTATPEEISRTGAVPGYASPIGLRDAFVIVDDLIPESPNLVVGANEAGFHLLNANYGRDYGADVVHDLTMAHPGDPCPFCGAKLTGAEAIIIADEAGLRPVETLRALAETFHDEKGLRMPKNVAPFDVYLVQISHKQANTQEAATSLCERLEAAGIEVLSDDRQASAGVKFNDADLIGCPLRLTIGERNLRDGMIELKCRDEDQIERVRFTEAADRVRALIGVDNA